MMREKFQVFLSLFQKLSSGDADIGQVVKEVLKNHKSIANAAMEGHFGDLGKTVAKST